MHHSLFKIVFLITLLLAGCGTLKEVARAKASCVDLNWYELGRGDGIRGEPSLKWKEKAKSCKGFGDTEHRNYTNGWYAGVDEFCSADHGYAFGKSGQPYFDVCPRSKEGDFLKTYRKGVEAFLYEKNLDRLSTSISDKRRAIQVTEAPEVKKNLLLELNTLEKEKIDNQNKLAQIESQMKTLQL